MGYYPNLRKEGKLVIPTTWVNLEDIMLGEISQRQINKHCMVVPM